MKHKMLIAACAALALGGCATTGLKPAPEANLVAGRTDAAYAVVSDVRLTVRTRSWSAYPTDLPSVLTPVEVTLENHSGHPLHVRYQDFSLVGPNGFRYAAIPPFAAEHAKADARSEAALAEGTIVLASAQVHGASPIGAPQGTPMPPPPPAPPAPAVQPAPAPRQPSGGVHGAGPMSGPPSVQRSLPPPPSAGMHAASPIAPPRGDVPPVVIHRRSDWDNFYVSPFYSPFYPGLGVWSGPFFGDPLFFNRYGLWSQYYGAWSQPLPTRDMVELALPEGVLQNNGTVSGFLYFPSIKREPSVTLQADLVDAQTNQPLGAASIPLVMQR